MTFARSLAAALLSLSFSWALAAPVQGTDYELLQPAQAQTVTGKVEIIEFFSYGCPHCYHLQPLLVEWKGKLPANAVLTKVPVSFGRREWGQLVRAFYALQATGDLARLDDKVFDAIHKDGKKLFDAESLTSWAAENGVNAAKFREAFNSQGVTDKAMKAEQLSRDYKVNGVPTLFVAGKYKVLGKDYPDMLRIGRELVDVK